MMMSRGILCWWSFSLYCLTAESFWVSPRREEWEGYFISFPVLVKFPENARSGEGAQTLLTFHSIPSRECDKLHLNCKLRGCNLSAQLSQSLSQWVKVSRISNSSSSASWKKSVPEFINTSVVRWDNKWHETKTLQSPSKSLPCRQISIRKPFQFTFQTGSGGC